LPLLILEAHGGTEGIRSAQNHKPDFIFLDLTMPGMTGFEVLEELKQTPETAEIPVAIVTSRILTQAEREVLQQKAVAILAKDNLESTDFAEMFRRASKERTLPLGAV
jgi:CheY-like chemotaxis protein